MISDKFKIRFMIQVIVLLTTILYHMKTDSWVYIVGRYDDALKFKGELENYAKHISDSTEKID